MKTYDESLHLKVSSPLLLNTLMVYFQWQYVTLEIKNGNWILVTNSYIYNHIFIQHNLKSTFTVPET